MIENQKKVLAVIPARGGSKGLPGKNIRTFAGLPLIAHSILMAKMCPEIGRIVVSTDDPAIAAVAKKFGAEAPFLRPKNLAEDTTPMWPVLRHALQAAEEIYSEKYSTFLLLDPTSPGRIPSDITAALQKLESHKEATGIVGVSQPEFNPIWHCVVEEKGWMQGLIQEGASYGRRQDVPPVYRINASLYIWRADFVKKELNDWRNNGKNIIFEIPEARAIHIDDLQEFERAELMVKNKLISFPWLNNKI